MWSSLRSARPLKKQECCLKFYGLLSVRRDSSNFRGDRAGGSCTEQLRSISFSSREEVHHCLPVFRSNSLANVSEGPDKDFEEREAVELASEPGFLEEDLSDSEEGLSALEPLKGKASLELLRTLVEIPTCFISSALDNFFKDGGDLSQEEASKIISCLQKRRMYGRALQFSELLGTLKHFELREHDYASRLDLIAKVQGLDTAEKYMNEVPETFGGSS
ncbi:hypothetical protein K1719_016196 [Acacia pycnantha]|nr:hypothetical protein K1719_016196 [Acacia pycnantha]